MIEKDFLNVATFFGDWTNTLLRECKRRAWHLSAFLVANDFQSYWKYYKEWMPFLKQFADQVRDAEISRLMLEYTRDNLQAIESGIKSKSGYYRFNCFDLDLPYSGTAELELALLHVMTNIGDLIYELNIRIIILSGTAKSADISRQQPTLPNF